MTWICIISKVRALKLIEILYSQIWNLTGLEDVSIIWRLVCDWLRREGQEQEVGLLSLVGCFRSQGGHTRTWQVKRGVDQQVRGLFVTLKDPMISFKWLSVICCSADSRTESQPTTRRNHMKPPPVLRLAATETVSCTSIVPELTWTNTWISCSVWYL